MPDIRVGFKVDKEQLKNDVKDATRDASKEIKSLGKTAKDAGEEGAGGFLKLNGGISGTLSVAGLAIQGFKEIYGVAKQIYDISTELARSYDTGQDIQRYFNQSFGIYSEEASEWAESLSDSYGLYTRDVQQFAAELNEAFIRAGSAASSAMMMTKDLTQMSYDLAQALPQYEIKEIQEMMRNLASGETEEVLKKLVRGYDSTTLSAVAAEHGIAEFGATLTTQQKQLAAYYLLMDENGKYTGAFGDALGTATGSISSMDSAITELKETLGQVLSPAVRAITTMVRGLVDGLNSTIKEFLDGLATIRNAAKDFVNWISEGLGFGTVFEEEADQVVESATKVTESTNAMKNALNSLKASSTAAANAMRGMAGFDRFYVLSNARTTDTGTGVDWQSAWLDWIDMLKTNPDLAVTAMNGAFGTILQSGLQTSDEIQDQYGHMFDWVFSEEIDQTGKTHDELMSMKDDFFGGLANLNKVYQEMMAEEEKRFAEEKEAFKRGESSKTMDQIEEEHNATVNRLAEEAENTAEETFIGILANFGVFSADELKLIKDAYDRAQSELEKQSLGAIGKLQDYAKAAANEIDNLIAKLKEAEALQNSNRAPAEDKSVLDKIVDVGHTISDTMHNTPQNKIANAIVGGIKDLLGFANGGVFEPNDPMLVKVGDSRTHREVIAPEDMIEGAVRRVMDEYGGAGGVTVIEQPVVITVDGAELARKTLKYYVNERTRQGRSSVF